MKSKAKFKINFIDFFGVLFGIVGGLAYCAFTKRPILQKFIILTLSCILQFHLASNPSNKIQDNGLTSVNPSPSPIDNFSSTPVAECDEEYALRLMYDAAFAGQLAKTAGKNGHEIILMAETQKIIEIYSKVPECSIHYKLATEIKQQVEQLLEAYLNQ